MKKKLFAVLSIAGIALGTFAMSSYTPVHAAEAAPDYENPAVLPVCTNGANGFANKPCWQSDGADKGQAHLAECSVSNTNFCYTLLVNDSPAPSGLKATVTVGSYKTHDSSNPDAGYEANVFLWRLPTGNNMNDDAWGVGKRPKDQQGNGGKFDLSGLLDASSQVSMVIKYKTTSLPQYSVLIADQGNMDFAISGQNLTLTLTGKPARVALESATQTINFDTEKNDDITFPWADRCGIPSMRFVVCNVNVADAQPLMFTARSKTFVNSPASDIPAPIWVNTNATYFHFPNVSVDATTGKKSIEFKTAAPHFLPDGRTVNTGNAAAFIPNGVLSQWQIEKTDAALKSALTSSIVKGDVITEVSATYTITDLGVKVYFPEITYSAPVIKVGQGTPKTATVATPKTLGKGKSKPLTSFIKLVGKGKATWKATGGCTIRSGKLYAPKKAANCKLTLSQAKFGKTAARKVSVSIKVS